MQPLLNLSSHHEQGVGDTGYGNDSSPTLWLATPPFLRSAFRSCSECSVLSRLGFSSCRSCLRGSSWCVTLRWGVVSRVRGETRSVSLLNSRVSEDDARALNQECISGKEVRVCMRACVRVSYVVHASVSFSAFSRCVSYTTPCVSVVWS